MGGASMPMQTYLGSSKARRPELQSAVGVRGSGTGIGIVTFLMFSKENRQGGKLGGLRERSAVGLP